MWPKQLQSAGTTPPARFNYARGLTLAHVASRHVVLVHWVRRQRQRFVVVWCDAKWASKDRIVFRSLERALLIANEVEGLRVADWEVYEPPSKQKMFVQYDPRWLRRRHQAIRAEFMRLRFRFRPSNRTIQDAKQSDSRKPAT